MKSGKYLRAEVYISRELKPFWLLLELDAAMKKRSVSLMLLASLEKIYRNDPRLKEARKVAGGGGDFDFYMEVHTGEVDTLGGWCASTAPDESVEELIQKKALIAVRRSKTAEEKSEYGEWYPC